MRLPPNPVRPARAAAYLLSGAVVGAVGCVLLVLWLALGIATAPLLVGLPLLFAAALVGLPVGLLERGRLRLVDPRRGPEPHAVPPGPGLRRWLSTRYREPATWRELAYTVGLVFALWPLDLAALVATVAVPLDLVAAPVLLAVGDGEAKLLKVWTVTTPVAAFAAMALGLVALAAGGYAMTWYAWLRGALTRIVLLRPAEAAGAVEIARSRARLADAYELERRRIERDLHDGAQQRLVALSMTLGLARVAAGAERDELVDRAYHDATHTLDELRELIRGIHPRVLTDRGLPAALDSLADRSPVPVDVHVELPYRLPAGVEAAGYFAVAEALTNVARHSGADRATVTGTHSGERLTIVVTDDGAGGADPAAGTGLAGLADRLAVVGGTLSLSSPAGGPTRLHLEIECRQSDPCA